MTGPFYHERWQQGIITVGSIAVTREGGPGIYVAVDRQDSASALEQFVVTVVILCLLNARLHFFRGYTERIFTNFEVLVECVKSLSPRTRGFFFTGLVETKFGAGLPQPGS